MKEKGIVKWFEDIKGYGYISREYDIDVFVRYTGILGEGYKTLSEGDKVTFDIIQGPKGLEAINVVKIN